METVGWAVTVLFAVVFFWLFLLYLWELNRTWMEHRRHRIEQRLLAHIKHRQINEAWWFSEDETTMHLLMDLANGIGVSEARKRWQMRRDPKEESKRGKT